MSLKLFHGQSTEEKVEEKTRKEKRRNNILTLEIEGRKRSQR
jgi:hypothetical protein